MSRDIPILMSAPMVLGTKREVEHPGTGKTQTRRMLYTLRKGDLQAAVHAHYLTIEQDGRKVICDPRLPVDLDEYWTLGRWHLVKPGDRLWVREAWSTGYSYDGDKPRDITPGAWVAYHADGPGASGINRPSLHMPRWASRLTLHVTEVRVQRLQEVSEEDAIAEGVEKVLYSGTNPLHFGGYGYRDYTTLPDGSPHPHAVVPMRSAVLSYATLMDHLHGAGFWRSNPWMVAITFVPELANIDYARRAA